MESCKHTYTHYPSQALYTPFHLVAMIAPEIRVRPIPNLFTLSWDISMWTNVIRQNKNAGNWSYCCSRAWSWCLHHTPGRRRERMRWLTKRWRKYMSPRRDDMMRYMWETNFRSSHTFKAFHHYKQTKPSWRQHCGCFICLFTYSRISKVCENCKSTLPKVCETSKWNFRVDFYVMENGIVE
jgi:hypothetical protein